VNHEIRREREGGKNLRDLKNEGELKGGWATGFEGLTAQPPLNRVTGGHLGLREKKRVQRADRSKKKKMFRNGRVTEGETPTEGVLMPA